MAAHAYWKLDNLNTAGTPPGNAISMAECYIRQTVGGANEIPIAFATSSVFGGFTGALTYDLNPATIWAGATGNVPAWISFQYAAPITCAELYMQARGDSSPFEGQTPTSGNIYFSDDGITWTLYKPLAFSAWSLGGIQTYTVPPAETPFINANKAVSLVVARFSTPEIDANKLASLVVFNFPTAFIQANKAVSLPVYRKAPEMRINKAAALVVCRGVLARPAVSPWTFTLDGHEYLVINTYNETLIYDFHAEHWYVWGSGDKPLWNPQIGQNWNANLGTIMAGLGGLDTTNIVCGDGTTSALYFLDTGLDEDFSSLGDPAKPYARIITGQLVSRSNNYTTLNGVEITASDGRTVVASDMDVTLQYSDNTGVTYDTFGNRTVIVGDFSPVLQWQSLGSFRQPGRLLRLTDYGALRRVDDWTTTDG